MLFGSAKPVVECEGEDRGRELSATVLGFLPYWIGDTSYLHYDLVSVLACFCVEMGSAGTITSWHGFPGIFFEELDSIHQAGGIGVVTVCCFSGSSVHSILTSASDTAIATLVDLVLDNTCIDGICIDFENVWGSDRDNLTLFVELLRSDLEAAAPGSHLSICTPPVDWSGAFDYDQLAEATDALMMMCYPFHGSWSTEAGPCCPLIGWGSTPSSPTNMMWTLGDYVICAPEVHEKLVIGLPYYGHQWETASSQPHSEVTGPCQTLFYETLAERAESYGKLWDDESLTPWYAFYYGDTWNQGWFDCDSSLLLKYQVILSTGMQGAGIWALGYDGERPELWQALEEAFAQPAQPDDRTDNLENSFLLHGPEDYWHYYGTGDLYSHFYTYSIASGPDINWAEWHFSLPDSFGALYSLQAWISAGAEATSAVYRIEHAGGTDTITIDQSQSQGQWVNLGEAYRTNGALQVVLGDSTGVSGQKICFDAIRFDWLTGMEEPEQPDPDEAGFLMEVLPCSPAHSFLIRVKSLSWSRIDVSIFDISGRLVSEHSVEPRSELQIVLPGSCRPLPAGIYFVRLEEEAEEGVAVTGCRKLVLLP